MNIQTIMRAVIHAHGNPNQYAGTIGVRQATVQRWAKGDGAPRELKHVLRLAQDAGYDFLLVLLVCLHTRETDAAVRRVLAQLIKEHS